VRDLPLDALRLLHGEVVPDGDAGNAQPAFCTRRSDPFEIVRSRRGNAPVADFHLAKPQLPRVVQETNEVDAAGNEVVVKAGDRQDDVRGEGGVSIGTRKWELASRLLPERH